MKEILQEKYAQEKEKMAEMSKEEKKEYILEYYKGWIIAIVLLICFFIWLPIHLIFNNADCGFSCVFVNGIVECGDVDLSDRLTEYYGFNERKEYAYFDSNFQIAYPGADNEAADYSYYEKFFLNIRSGSMDVAIMPESYMEYCFTVEPIFVDVTEVLDSEQIKKYERYFVYGKNEAGEEYPCGIDISNFAFVEEEELCFVKVNNTEKMILTFPMNATRTERCQKFMRFLEAYEK